MGIDKIIHSNIIVSAKIKSLERRVEHSNSVYGRNISDQIVQNMFDPANLDILETIKNDRSLLFQLHSVTNNNNDNISIKANSSSLSFLPSLTSSTTTTETNTNNVHHC